MADITPHPVLAPGALRDALARTMAEERTAATATTASLRRGASFGFLVLLVVVWSLTRNEGWRVYLLPMALHAGGAGVAYVLRKRPIAGTLAPVAGVLDAALVAVAQYLTLPHSAFPAGVAGFSLGLFSMVVMLNALTLRPEVVATTTLAAIAGQVVLMREAGVAWGPVGPAAAVLLVVAIAGHALTRRMRAVMTRFAAAEIARELERRHSAEVEEARRTIEGMLDESRAQNDRLEQLQRDKESLTQLLVHDLRSPITVIVGYVDLVKLYLEESGAPQNYVRALEQTLGTATRLTSMISDLLQIAKLEDGKLVLNTAPLDAVQVVRDLGAESRGMVEPRQVLEIVATGEAPLDADPTLLRRVLENLVSNATRFTPKGQRIRLAAELDGREVVLLVQNDGPPIDSAARERLFDKYQQGRNARVGWGLGLYFCRLAVEAHGGSIRIEDREGFSTTFAIRLPRRAAESATRAA